MTSRITPANLVVLILLGMSFYSSTILPGAGFLAEIIGAIQFVLLITFAVVSIDSNPLQNQLPQMSVSNMIIVLLFAVFGLSIILNLPTNISFESVFKILSYLALFIVLFIYFSNRLVINDELFEKFLDYLIYFGVAASVFSLSIYFMGISLHPNPNFIILATGFFMHPNTTSHLYTILIPIVVYKFISGKHDMPQFLGLLTLFFAALLFTYSRAGYIGVSIALLIISFAKSKKLFFVTVIVLVAAVYLVLLDFFSAKGDSSISRFLLWITAVNMIVSDPSHFLFGYGVKNALTIFQGEKFFFGSIEDVPDPHNVLLLFSIQFGVLFTAILTALITYTVLKVLLTRHNDLYADKRFKLYLCISVIAGLIFQNMLENVLAYPEHFVFNTFLIMIGYLYHFNSLNDSSNRSGKSVIE